MLWKAFKKLKGFSVTPNAEIKRVYLATYIVRLKNPTSSVVEGSAVIPIAPNRTGQKIAKLRMTPHPALQAYDQLYHNKYSVYNVRLGLHETYSIVVQFQATLHPLTNDISPSLSMHDYANLNPTLLQSNRFVKITSTIAELAKRIIGDESNLKTILNRLNEYTVNHLVYGRPIEGLYTVDDALTNPCVDCGGFDTLLASLCLAIGIPTRIVAGFWAGYKQNGMHAWLEIFLPDGTWLPADPSIEHLRALGKTAKTGGLGVVGSDRIVFSQGCDIPVAIHDRIEKVDILQHPTVFAKDLSSFVKETELMTKVI